jgi:uncharacterized protein (TIGR02611 family)
VPRLPFYLLSLKAHVKIWPLLRKLAVVVIGFPLVLIGLIMIPLPGPGLLIIVSGLFVLSLEFEWARRHLAYTRGKLNSVLGTSARFSNGVRGKWSTWRASRRGS